MRNEKKGFSLAEIAITITIIGLLAGVGVPIFMAQIEQAREQEATSNLMMIYTAEMTYRYNSPSAVALSQTYWPAAGTVSDIAAINSGLGISLQENYYDLSVTRIPGNPGDFQATAVRIGGTKTFTISKNGSLQGTDTQPGGGS